jgi:predicted nucleic acid-binding protein
MTLIDTSAWIEYLRQTNSREDLLLQSLFQKKSPILVPAVVYQEVAQGARNPKDFATLTQLLDSFADFECADLRSTHGTAASIYARCTWGGFQPRSSNDCLIAAIAIEADVPLLARDRDFLHIAQIEPRLKLFNP